MSSYSFPGYITALGTRTSRTLIVEGPDDKKIIAGLIRRFEVLGVLRARKVVVDTADMINGPTGVCGSRAVVEAVHAEATRLGLDLFAFVDREFRNFVFGPPVIDTWPDHHVASSSLIWTRGHSAENYAFHKTTIESFLSRIVPEHVDADLSDRAVAAVPDLLHWAAAFSIACARQQVVTRCTKMLSLASWDVDASGCPTLSLGVLRSQIIARGVPAAQADIIIAELQTFEQSVRQCPSEASRWISHGHIGSDGLWTGVGKILATSGLSPSVAQDIATGHRDTKVRIAAEIWGDQVKDGQIVMPPEFIDWLKQ